MAEKFRNRSELKVKYYLKLINVSIFQCKTNSVIPHYLIKDDANYEWAYKFLFNFNENLNGIIF